MDAKMTFSQDLIDQFANAIVERLLPRLEMPKQDEDEMLNTVQAAILLGKSKQQIYQWANKAKHGLMVFPYMKAGRSLRFSKNDLIEWMKKQAKG